MWNHFNDSLVNGVMEICNKHLADEGFLVTLSLAQHLGKIDRFAGRSGLKLHRLWTLNCDGGYVHPDTNEQVCNGNTYVSQVMLCNILNFNIIFE